MSRLPFREMRRTLQLTMAQCGLLLGLDVLKWSDRDYALFMVMTEVWQKQDNPTYNQMLVFVGAWLRYYGRLIEVLPAELPLREQAQVEFDKLSVGYEDLLTGANNESVQEVR